MKHDSEPQEPAGNFALEGAVIEHDVEEQVGDDHAEEP